MVEYKVLVTTSGIGSRLGELTNYTNKCLVRVGKKPAISYIIESYPKETQFVITCGYYGQQVKDFLSLAYPEINFTFVDIDNYSGAGSSLGYSMIQAKEYLQCPFIFHAADTIVEEPIPEPTINWIAYSKKENYSQYRTIDLVNPKIFEKGHIGSNLAYIGLCGIKDYELFWNCLMNEYNRDTNDGSLSDCHAINKMIDKKWKFVKYNTWYDIGNVSELNITRQSISDKFHILDKVDESIYLFDDFIIKFFYDKEICQNRVKRCEILGNLTPNILGYTDNFYKYSKVEGDLLSEIVDEKIFGDFLKWSVDNLWIKQNSNYDFANKVNDFYFKKTQSRLDKFFQKNNLKDEPETINGFSVPTINEMVSSISRDWLCRVYPYQYHGDFILDNIIYTQDKKFKLIDWRQDFSGELENGDMYYDLAKLNHNLLFNHEIITSGNFSVEVLDNSTIRFDILRSDILTNCRDILHQFIVEYELDLKKVKLLTAIIWLNMAPLHEPKIGRLLYYLGKLNLYKVLYD